MGNAIVTLDPKCRYLLIDLDEVRTWGRGGGVWADLYTSLS